MSYFQSAAINFYALQNLPSADPVEGAGQHQIHHGLCSPCSDRESVLSRRCFPQDERDLVIAASDQHVLAFENGRGSRQVGSFVDGVEIPRSRRQS